MFYTAEPANLHPDTQPCTAYGHTLATIKIPLALSSQELGFACPPFLTPGSTDSKKSFEQVKIIVLLEKVTRLKMWQLCEENGTKNCESLTALKAIASINACKAD